MLVDLFQELVKSTEKTDNDRRGLEMALEAMQVCVTSVMQI